MATLPKPTPRAKSKAVVPPMPRKSAPAQMPAAKAKARFLELLDTVHETHSPIVITKRGKPVAQLMPIEEKPAFEIFGCMKDTVTYIGDIVSPEPDVWEAMTD